MRELVIGINELPFVDPMVGPRSDMSTDFILFFVAVVIVLLGPMLSLLAKRKLKALKKRLASEHCPKCREIFGPSIIRTAQRFRGFIDPAPTGPVLKVVCPHCRVAWDYCNGSYTESSVS